MPFGVGAFGRRHVGSALVAAALVARGADAEPPLVLAVRLTTTVAMAAPTRVGLVHEVDAIWSRSGVRIEWLPAVVPVELERPALRVLVASSSGSRRRGDVHTWPVAELLGDQSGRAVALASVEAAYEVLAVAGRAHEPSALVERRLGVVLGRAVAHEIGHFLLGSGAHGRRGLMRAAIPAADFADLREGGFWLDAEATHWIRASSPASSDGRRLARFIYR